MPEFKSIWTDKYRVSWFDTDGNNQARLVAICKYLQESAWNHANHLGFGYRTASKFNQVWVIVRMLVKMERYPLWEDIVTIRTWPRGVVGLLALRDFEILSSSGERLGAASSQWFILDAATHKPQPLLIIQDILPLVTSTPVMEQQPEKIQIPSPLPFAFSTRARYSDLDMYRHVNNTRLIEWIMNVFPEEVHRKRIIRSFLIEFLAETNLDDDVHVFAGPAGDSTVIRGVRESDDRTLFRARVEWSDRPDTG